MAGLLDYAASVMGVLATLVFVRRYGISSFLVMTRDTMTTSICHQPARSFASEARCRTAIQPRTTRLRRPRCTRHVVSIKSVKYEMRSVTTVTYLKRNAQSHILSGRSGKHA